MISLFSHSLKQDNSIELEKEANRARLEAAIERALQIPEVDMSNVPEGMQFAAQQAVKEKAEVAMDPWDTLKEFVVREDVTEHAA